MPLSVAVEHGREAMVQLLLEHGAEVNPAVGNAWTPLHWAVRRGDVAMCRLLIDAGADVDPPRSRSDKTPLVYAALGGHQDVVVLLVESGADVNVTFREFYGTRSALYWPKRKGYANIVRYLENHGVKD